MPKNKWKIWASTILWIHILATIGVGIVYGFITFFKPVPFNEIFHYTETAPYYLMTYALVLIYTFSLCAMGSVFKDVFGHKDLRAQLVSKAMLVIGLLGSLLPLMLITMWDMVLTHPDAKFWIVLANVCQHFGIWLIFIITIIYALTLLLIFILGKEHSQIPDGWAELSLVVAILMGGVALSCFWISHVVIVFRVVYLICLIGYLAWTIWFALLLPKLDQKL